MIGLKTKIQNRVIQIVEKSNQRQPITYNLNGNLTLFEGFKKQKPKGRKYDYELVLLKYVGLTAFAISYNLLKTNALVMKEIKSAINPMKMREPKIESILVDNRINSRDPQFIIVPKDNKIYTIDRIVEANEKFFKNLSKLMNQSSFYYKLLMSYPFIIATFLIYTKVVIRNRSKSSIIARSCKIFFSAFTVLIYFTSNEMSFILSKYQCKSKEEIESMWKANCTIISTEDFNKNFEDYIYMRNLMNSRDSCSFN